MPVCEVAPIDIDHTHQYILNYYVMTVCDSYIAYSRSIKTVTASFGLALASYPSVKDIMESKLVKKSVVRGHHIYKEVWSPVVGELLPVLQESINVHDR